MKFLLYSLLFLFIPAYNIANEQRINIIAEPVSIIEKDGNFMLGDKTVIVISTDDICIEMVANLFIEQLASLAGIRLKTIATTSKQNTITIKL